MKNLLKRHVSIWGKHAFFFTVLVLSGIISCSNEKEIPVENDKVWIPGWKKTSKMTIPRAGAAIIQYGNYIYMIGGVDGKVFLSTIESAKINHDGTLSEWKVVSKLPEDRGFISAAVYNNRVYVVGGGNGSFGKNLLNSVVSASLVLNGKIGEWRTEKEAMRLPRRCSKIFFHENKLFALGGFGGALLDNVEYSEVNKRGELSEWMLLSEKLTMPRYVNSLKKINNKVFVVGGHHESKGSGIKDVEFLDLNDENMIWKSGSPMLEGRYAFSAAAYQERLYALGGISGAEYLNTIEMLDVSGDTLKNKWHKSANLPEYMANFTTLVFGKQIYLFGGSTRQEYLNDVWFSSFDDDGNIGYWGTQTELDAFNTKRIESDNQPLLPNVGKVINLIQTESYTYILVVNSQEKEVWIAAPVINVGVGENIRFSNGVYMSNFYSKTLKRKFPAINFVGSVTIER